MAHQEVECSNRGLCDRSSVRDIYCSFFIHILNYYFGRVYVNALLVLKEVHANEVGSYAVTLSHAIIEQFCLKIAACNCHGHGTCATINTLYESMVPLAVYTGPYLLWDKESTSMCHCDVGYTGPGCSLSKSNPIVILFYRF